MFDEAVDVLHLHPGPRRDAALARGAEQMRKMGGIGQSHESPAGYGKMKDALKTPMSTTRRFKRQEAIIQFHDARRAPQCRSARRLAQASRIAAGSGMQVQDVNRLIKQFLEMQKVMKQVRKLGQKGFMRGMMPKLMGGDLSGN